MEEISAQASALADLRAESVATSERHVAELEAVHTAMAALQAGTDRHLAELASANAALTMLQAESEAASHRRSLLSDFASQLNDSVSRLDPFLPSFPTASHSADGVSESPCFTLMGDLCLAVAEREEALHQSELRFDALRDQLSVLARSLCCQASEAVFGEDGGVDAEPLHGADVAVGDKLASKARGLSTELAVLRDHCSHLMNINAASDLRCSALQDEVVGLYSEISALGAKYKALELCATDLEAGRDRDQQIIQEANAALIHAIVDGTFRKAVLSAQVCDESLTFFP